MNKKSQRRKQKIRSKIKTRKDAMRLCIHRTNTSIYAQLIDEKTGKTIAGVSDKHLENQDAKQTKTKKAHALGLLVAKKAIDKKVKKVVFDRGSYAYHGRVKALAEGAREGGLQF